jgi:hypothetical protein
MQLDLLVGEGVKKLMENRLELELELERQLELDFKLQEAD